MKKNCISSYFKTFALLPTIFISLGLIAVGYISFNLNVMNKELVQLAIGGLYTLFVGFAIIGLKNVNKKEVDFIDFIRVTGFIGSAGLLVVSLMQDVVWKNRVIIYAVVAAVLLIQIIIRIIFARRASEDRVGFNQYISSVYNKFNPVILAVLGVAISTVLYFTYKDIAIVKDFINKYAAGISVVGIVVILLYSANKKDQSVSILDALLQIALYACIAFILYYYNKFDRVDFKSFLLITAALFTSIIFRGASFAADQQKQSKLKINCYYADVYSRFDILLSLAIAGVLVTMVVLQQFGDVRLTAQIVKYLKINDFSIAKYTDIINYIVIGAVGVLIALVAVFHKIKSSTVRMVDYVLSILGHVCLFLIPYFVILIADNKIGTIFDTLSTGILLCVILVALVLVLVLKVVRYTSYKVILDAASSPIEEQVEDQVEEQHDELIEKSITDETLQDFDEAAFNEFIQENIQEVEIDESLEAEESVEEATEPEEVEESTEEAVEVMYVDADGNPVDYVDGDTIIEEVSSEDDAIDEADEADEDDNDEADEADEDDNDEELLEESVNEAEVVEVQAKEKGIFMPEVNLVDENGVPKKIKRKFNTRMMFATYEAKEYYNEIKNYLIMYRAKGRYSARCETFRYRGLVAKVALAGKSIKVCLAIDPTSLEGSKYHYKDVSDKKQYVEVPTMIKVRSQRGLKYFKELVDLMMAARAVKPKRNFQPSNFLPLLIPNGEAILATLGMSTDYLYPTMNVRSVPAEMPEDLASFLPVIQGEELDDTEVEASVYLDTLCNHFVDGDEITIDLLKSMHIVTKGNVLRIKARGTLDRKLIIYAEYFDEEALKMLLCTNCTVIKIVR